MKNGDWMTYLGVALVLGAGAYAVYTFYPRGDVMTPAVQPTGNTTPIVAPNGINDQSVTLPDGTVLAPDPAYVADPGFKGSNSRATVV